MSFVVRAVVRLDVGGTSEEGVTRLSSPGPIEVNPSKPGREDAAIGYEGSGGGCALILLMNRDQGKAGARLRRRDFEMQIGWALKERLPRSGDGEVRLCAPRSGNIAVLELMIHKRTCNS